MTTGIPVLDIGQCSVRFGRPGADQFYAVREVSLQVAAGEVLGLVGESGCGKTTLSRAIVGLIPLTSGSITVEGKSLVDASKHDARSYRRAIGMVFQNPYMSLNPRHTVYDILAEPLRLYGICRGRACDERVAAMAHEVGLDNTHLLRYPHEFSGGQRQRIAIGRALIAQPHLLIADEPVSALDVSIQAQILNLLQTMVEKRTVAMLFISHDLAVVRHVSHRIAVMNKGRIVERGAALSLFNEPQHAYTQMLLHAIAVPDPKVMRLKYERLTE